jgi:hypothetical protein
MDTPIEQISTDISKLSINIDNSEQKKSELPSLPPSPVLIALPFSKWKCIGCGLPFFLKKFKL